MRTTSSFAALIFVIVIAIGGGLTALTMGIGQENAKGNGNDPINHPTNGDPTELEVVR